MSGEFECSAGGKDIEVEAVARPNLLRVCTWNAEWAEPTSERGRRVRRRLEAVEVDLIVLTEGSSGLLPAAGHVIDGGVDWGYPVRDPLRRKVLMWSRTPWRDVDVAKGGATSGRLVAGVTLSPIGPVTVVGVCIPWRDAHVRTGRRDRQPWEEHLSHLDGLGQRLRKRASATPVIVAGDMNQRVPRLRQPEGVAAALSRVFSSMAIHTAGETPDGRLIDHIVTSNEFRLVERHTWSGQEDDIRLSDHAGVSVVLAPP